MRLSITWLHLLHKEEHVTWTDQSEEPSFPETVTNDANWNNPPKGDRDDIGAVDGFLFF